MSQPALTSSIGMIKEVFETNLFGVIEVTQAFIDLLRQSPAPRIVERDLGAGLAHAAQRPFLEVLPGEGRAPTSRPRRP
ncbi:MAG: hypothetical protein WKG07_37115 [Hymenobacter sp.]